ncbi:aspartate dehydrogenase [Methanothermobacter sp. THM-2]|uniref:aspartate dehydrogenase n=1 Tax=Methanothermobacter sp. THM-2 TaxID=2606912 RepID=UPI001365362B|nr:aspartate dehydrogenase [Methanothermobacter sp. THM-2]QHN08003.1 aspartate dehydrogenase [Methanothermobacter sp. THM-2]
MIVGIVGCGAIANLITGFVRDGRVPVELGFFYDRDLERAENLASMVDGTAVLDVADMLPHVDLVVEAASPEAVRELVPGILEAGRDVVVMSVGALMDPELRSLLEKKASENNAEIHVPSGAIVGLDGLKAASMGSIKSVKLVTRKPPRSLGISMDEKKVLYTGKASEAVKRFPLNINVAAALSLACGRDIDVEIIADPAVDRNVHEVTVKGDFGEFKTITENVRCSINPKTSVMAAYSAIRLLKSLSENMHIGT